MKRIHAAPVFVRRGHNSCPDTGKAEFQSLEPQLLLIVQPNNQEQNHLIGERKGCSNEFKQTEGTAFEESRFRGCESEKRSRVAGRIVRYMAYTIFVAMWAMVSLLGYIAVVDTAIKTELIDTTSLAAKYKALVALAALVLMWVSGVWMLKKILPRVLETKPPQIPLSVFPRFNHAESTREQTIRHGIYAAASVLVVLFASTAIISLAGKSTTITIQIPTLLTSNITIQFHNLSTDSIHLIGWTVLGAAVLINIVVRPTTRQLFLEALSGIWKFVKNLFGF